MLLNETAQRVVRYYRTVHRSPRRRGCELLYLLPYSPDFNPIEEAFFKIEGLLRMAQARTRKALVEAMGATIRRSALGMAVAFRASRVRRAFLPTTRPRGAHAGAMLGKNPESTMFVGIETYVGANIDAASKLLRLPESRWIVNRNNKHVFRAGIAQRMLFTCVD